MRCSLYLFVGVVGQRYGRQPEVIGTLDAAWHGRSSSEATSSFAAFAAMREVEVQVRERAGLSNSLVGTPPMQQAFGQERPLWRRDLDGGESVALMQLYNGAIGLFKNPPSHRRVDCSDPTEASEIVLLADLLLACSPRSNQHVPPTTVDRGQPTPTGWRLTRHL